MGEGEYPGAGGGSGEDEGVFSVGKRHWGERGGGWGGERRGESSPVRATEGSNRLLQVLELYYVRVPGQRHEAIGRARRGDETRRIGAASEGCGDSERVEKWAVRE